MARDSGEIKPSYDVVIIGAGVSGLTSAALFSRAGLSVCVLEMDARPGGYLAGFRRKDFRFDSAIHWLNQMGPNGFSNRIFRSIGSDFPQAREQALVRRYIVGDLDLMLTNKPDELRDQLIEKFPHEKSGLIRFFNAARRISRGFDSFSTNFRDLQTRNLWGKCYHGMRLAKMGLTFIPHIFYNGEKGLKKGLDRYFKDPELQKFWCSEEDLLSCLIPISWAYSNDYQFPPIGGSQVFPEWLEHVTNELGNKVHYQTKVARIEDDGKQATAVVAFQKGVEIRIEAKYVVAACDVEALYERMMNPKLSRPKFLKKLDTAKLYSSAVTLSIGLDCPSENLGFGEEMLLIADTDIQRDEHNAGDPHKSDLSVLAPSLRDKSLAPEGKGTLTIYSPAWFDQYNFWGTDRDEKGEFIRGAKYEKIKEDFAQIILERIEKALNTSIRPHIVYMDIATPITHYRYTGNRQGSMMGAKPCKENYKAGIAHYRTPLKNVFLSGHWANLGGGVPIAMSTAANSTLLILRQEKPKAYTLLGDFYDGKIDEATLNSSVDLKSYSNSWKMKPTPAVAKRLRSASSETNSLAIDG